MVNVEEPILFEGLREELEKAMRCDKLAYLLEGKMGALPKKFWFISKCINDHLAVSISIPSLKKNYKLIHIIYLLQSIIKTKNKNTIDLLIVTRNRFISKQENHGAKKDYLFSSIIDELKNNDSSLKMECLIMDISCHNSTDIPVYSELDYLRPTDVLRSIFEVAEFLYIWLLYKKPIINYLQKNDCNFVASQLFTFFSIKDLIKYSLIGASIKNLIIIKKPKLIISNDDILYLKCTTDYNNGVSVVLQSANLHPKKECCKSLLFEDPFLLPDYLLLSGDAFRKALVGRMAKNYIVTGQPRYDEIFKFNKLNDVLTIKKHLNINTKEFTILWATQLQGSCNEENFETIHALFGVLDNMKNIKLIIKQHPNEEQIYTELLLSNISRYKIDYILVPKNSSMNELLFISDLLITKNSSTCREAVLFAKPIIILDLSKKPYSSEYIEEGVAKAIYSEKELREAIVGLLKDDAELAKNRARYINNYLYRNDGMATTRIVSLVEKLTKETNI